MKKKRRLYAPYELNRMYVWHRGKYEHYKYSATNFDNWVDSRVSTAPIPTPTPIHPRNNVQISLREGHLYTRGSQAAHLFCYASLESHGEFSKFDQAFTSHLTPPPAPPSWLFKCSRDAWTGYSSPCAILICATDTCTSLCGLRRRW